MSWDQPADVSRLSAACGAARCFGEAISSLRAMTGLGIYRMRRRSALETVLATLGSLAIDNRINEGGVWRFECGIVGGTK